MRDTDFSPSCPALRRARSAFVDHALSALGQDDRVVAAGFVGSLGRGNADDWSDIDLLFVVADANLDDFERPSEFPGAESATLTFDARHNAPRGAHATSGQYITDALPLWVDWYVYPLSLGLWVSDSRTEFDRIGLPRSADSFDEHLSKGMHQPATSKPADAHAMLQLALVPMAGKRIARRSADTARMIAFLGGTPTSDEPADQMQSLRRLLDSYTGRRADAAVVAGHRYLDLVAETI